MTFQSATSIEVPIEKTTLQVLVSGRILVTGILNEILLTLPEEKNQSEFLIESECSLLMDSEARKAVQEYAKGINMMELLCSSSSSLPNASKYRDHRDVPNENSLWSLYKESQGTDEYTSDLGSKRSAGDPLHKIFTDKTSDMSRPKSNEYRGTSGYGSAKSSKSVTFISQNVDNAAHDAANHANKDSNLAGLCIDECRESDDAKDAARSMSKKFPWTMAGHLPPGRTASSCSFDDGELWLSFLVDTGLLQGSDPNVELSDIFPRYAAKLDDPEHILRQLAIYRTIGSQTFTTNIRDDYEEIHRNSPGTFWDTITMDDPEEAFQKAKRILKDIFEMQRTLKPMFDIDYSKNEENPFIKQRLEDITKHIAQERFFF